MGILSRWRHLSTPRAAGTGKIWDNVNSGGHGVGSPHVTVTQFTTPADTNAYTSGPDPEPYLNTGESIDLNRTRSPYLHLQPEIPVSQPWYASSTYIQNTNTSTGQYKNQVQKTQLPSGVKPISPPFTTQRDTLYDDVNFHRQQRFYFAKTSSQVYFDERTPLPEFTTPSVPTNAVIAGGNGYFPTMSQPGWRQSLVPEPGRRDIEYGTSPPWLLSTPLNVKQITYSEYDRPRLPLKAKAPKRQRSGG